MEREKDLANQIISLRDSHTFDYLLIEASGVCAPSQITKLFALDHKNETDEEVGATEFQNFFPAA